MQTRLVVLAAVAAIVLVVTPDAARGSCVPMSVAEQEARAEVIVEGVIRAGAKPGNARLRVSRYVKGNGPPELAITGGNVAGVVSSIDVAPSAGERWRILGKWRGARTVLTTECDGSARVEERGSPASDDRAPAAPVAPPESGDGSPPWLPVLLVVVGIAGLVAVWLRRSRRSRRAEPDATTKLRSTS
jgi:hypothetical protein